MSSGVPWWVKSAPAAPSASATNVDDSIIDLTSDAEDSSSPGMDSAPPRGSFTFGDSPGTSSAVNGDGSKVKNEGAKRAAADAMADRSGDVQVTSKPAQEMESFSRPAKRSKGAGEEDVEMVGRNGAEILPHNRFSCPENPFDLAREGTHKNRCKLCFCYVCNRPATLCSKWEEDHCHASDAGDRKNLWKVMRDRAKLAFQLGSPPPVSGLYRGRESWSASSAARAAAAASPAPRGAASPAPRASSLSAPRGVWSRSPAAASAAASSGGGSSSPSSSASSGASPANVKPSPTAHLPNDCNCEKLCKPVHKIFKMDDPNNNYLGGKVPVVYLKGLTVAEVLHVEKIAVKATVKRLAKKSVERSLPRHHEYRKDRLKLDMKERMPHVHKAQVGNGTFDMMVASNGIDRHDARRQTAPWLPTWTPGGVGTTSGSVRLGGIVLGFNLTTCGLVMPLERRQAYFDHYITETPLPTSIWFAVTDSMIIDRNSPGELTMCGDDHKLVRYLQTAHEARVINVHMKATYDSATNDGEVKLEVLLLPTIFNRGTSMKPRSYMNLATVVERVVFPDDGSPPAGPSSSSSSSASSPRTPSSSASRSPFSPVLPPHAGNGAAVGGGALAAASSARASAGKVGRTFAPSRRGYGGRASLDVTLSGLMKSVLAEEKNERIEERSLFTPAKLLNEMENLQHRALIEQPDCLTVQLYEHQLQDTQWMYDQEMLDGGSKQHLWAELPPHPLAPSNGVREGEFRTCWFSPVLNLFTTINPLQSGMKGGILCDEMGLGKTAATLALHLVNPAKTPSEGVPLDEKEWGTISGRQATPLVCPKSINSIEETPGSVVSKGTLVVCKLSLVGQWVEEAKRLSGGALTIYPYHGGNRKKDPNFLAQFDLVVTTYGVVQADASRNKGFPPLRRIRWWRVALDESHTIANTTGAAAVVKQLIANRRWCITGTPYVSKFSDVNGQLGFIGLEGAFHAADFGDQRPNIEAQGATLALLRRVLLRHSQGMTLGGRSILGLPTISHKVEELTLPPKERKAYAIFERAVQRDYVGVRHKLLHASGSHTMEVLTLLSKFRQACSGGQLLVGQSGESGGGGSAASCVDAFCPMCSELLESPVRTPCGHVFCQACITSALTKAHDEESPCPKCKRFVVGLHDLTPVGNGGGSSSSSSGYGAKQEPRESSGAGGRAQGGGSEASPPGVVMETKLKALVSKLSAIHAQDPTSKSLVFSQFNSSLEWLKRSLPKRGFQFRTLTGGMSRTQRTNALKAFANDPPTTVFLLSVRSGAVGINLTQANNVFLLEPLLNLALEKQAVGRVYRLGQSRPVTVTKLVLKDSIETRILALQKRQASSAGSASSSAGAGSSSSGVAGNISKDDNKNLKIEEYNSLFGLSEGHCKSESESEREALLAVVHQMRHSGSKNVTRFR